ncbi:MAG: GFA family protein [Polyangiaceae bacterium]|nr:GFA family protein [Polyangiaceae bacterium]
MPPSISNGPHLAKCHCGAVEFEVTLVDGLNTARRCTCSMCSKRGAVAVSAALGGLRVISGAEKLSEYQFNTKEAKHFFCSVCGIYTHHQRRSNPNQYGVNAACLPGISPFDFENVLVLDGVNHPRDTSGKTQVVGVLSFSRGDPSAS